VSGYRWRAEGRTREAETAAQLAAIRAEAAARVPEWQPWMTQQRGYAGMSKRYLEEHGWRREWDELEADWCPFPHEKRTKEEE
jgi:hypothetical protein